MRRKMMLTSAAALAAGIGFAMRAMGSGGDRSSGT